MAQEGQADPKEVVTQSTSADEKKSHPSNAYSIFYSEQVKRLRESCGITSIQDISRIISKKWRALQVEDRAKYHERAKELNSSRGPRYSHTKTMNKSANIMQNFSRITEMSSLGQLCKASTKLTS